MPKEKRTNAMRGKAASGGAGLTIVGHPRALLASEGTAVPRCIQALSPEHLDILHGLWRRGLQAPDVLDRFEIETGIRIDRRSYIDVSAIFFAQSVDEYRARAKPFIDDVDRADFYIDEMGTVVQQCIGSSDHENYAKFLKEMRSWLLLKHQLLNPIKSQTNNLTINVNEDEAKQALLVKLTGLIAKQGSGGLPSLPEPDGSQNSSE